MRCSVLKVYYLHILQLNNTEQWVKVWCFIPGLLTGCGFGGYPPAEQLCSSSASVSSWTWPVLLSCARVNPDFSWMKANPLISFPLISALYLYELLMMNHVNCFANGALIISIQTPFSIQAIILMHYGMRHSFTSQPTAESQRCPVLKDARRVKSVDTVCWL